MSMPPTPPTSPPAAVPAAVPAPMAAPPVIPTTTVSTPAVTTTTRTTTHPPPTTTPPKITPRGIANTTSRTLLHTTLTLSTQLRALDQRTAQLHETYRRKLRRQMQENRKYIFNHLCPASYPSPPVGGGTGEECDGVVDVSDAGVTADERLQGAIARAHQGECEVRCRRARGLYAAAVQRAQVAMEAVEGFERVVVELPGRVDDVLRGWGEVGDGDEEDEDEGQESRDEQNTGTGDGEDEQADEVQRDQGCVGGEFDLAGKLLRDSMVLKKKIDGILRENERKRGREDEEGGRERYEYDVVSVSLRHSLMIKRRLDVMYQETRHGMKA